ncbi:MAG: flagellar biosynthesis protein FliQ [Clostridiaceae bacterium]|nr:flagellar biosynthesis protein FliQ [Clostridiaceae bacterium]
MSQGEILTIMQQAIYTMLKVSAPLLLVALAVGLIVSVFQAMTQINEQTLVFIPKIVGTLLVLVLLGSWMMTTLVEFTDKLFSSIATLIQ